MCWNQPTSFLIHPQTSQRGTGNLNYFSRDAAQTVSHYVYRKFSAQHHLHWVCSRSRPVSSWAWCHHNLSGKWMLIKLDSQRKVSFTDMRITPKILNVNCQHGAYVTDHKQIYIISLWWQILRKTRNLLELLSLSCSHFYCATVDSTEQSGGKNEQRFKASGNNERIGAILQRPQGPHHTIIQYN